MMGPSLRTHSRLVSRRQPASEAFRTTSSLWRLVSRILVTYLSLLATLYETSCFLPTRLLEASHVKCEAFEWSRSERHLNK